MKRLLLFFIALFCTNSAFSFYAGEHEIHFSQQRVDSLITYLAEGNSIVPLNDLTCFSNTPFSISDRSFVAEEVALMRATGLVVKKTIIEDLLKIYHKYAQLLATLKACGKLNVPYEEQTSPLLAQEEIEQLEKAVTWISELIALCAPENIDDTVEYALDITSTAEVATETKKALIERIRHVNNSEKINALCDNTLTTL